MDDVVARLDVQTWEFRDVTPDDEPPPGESAARRWFNTLTVLVWLLMLLGAPMMFLIIADARAAALPLALAVCLVGAAASIAALQHRRMRRITGVPVIAELYDLLQALAALLALLREIEHESPEHADPDLDTNLRRMARPLIGRCELALRAQRGGRWRARNRHVRWLFRQCQPLLQRMREVQEQRDNQSQPRPE